MDESFELPVWCQNKEILLPAQLHQYGYSYKIEVETADGNVYFERDEEGNWRALTDQSRLNDTASIVFIKAIADSLEKLLK